MPFGLGVRFQLNKIFYVVRGLCRLSFVVWYLPPVRAELDVMCSYGLCGCHALGSRSIFRDIMQQSSNVYHVLCECTRHGTAVHDSPRRTPDQKAFVCMIHPHYALRFRFEEQELDIGEIRRLTRLAPLCISLFKQMAGFPWFCVCQWLNLGIKSDELVDGRTPNIRNSVQRC